MGSKSLIKSTGLVSILTILSRLLGFVRDHVVARAFGAGLITDIFFVAFRIPNLLRSLVAEGALTSAFVPIFSDDEHASSNTAEQTFAAALSCLLILTTSLTLAGILTAPLLVRLMGAGFSDNPESLQLGVDLSRIMLPYIICISFVALCNGALNVRNIYGSSPLSQTIMNVCMIFGGLGALWTDSQLGIYFLAVSVLMGGLAQVLFQIPYLKRAKIPLTISLQPFTPSVRKMLLLMIPAIFGAAVYQVSIFMTTLLASLLPDGSISYLQFADRLSQLPIGIFSIALGSVLLPMLSRSASTQNWTSYGNYLNLSLSLVSLVMIPIACGMFYYSDELVRLVFESGRFTAGDSLQTSNALKVMCLALWSSSCVSMLMRAFIATKDTLTPSLIGVITLVANFALSLGLMGDIQSKDSLSVIRFVQAIQQVVQAYFPTGNFAHVGLAFASTIASFLSVLILVGMLSKRSIPLDLGGFLRATAGSLLASACML
ncbi:MAG: murein biosynthesis integral membrane protein MurJ, partial [Bdellovibrionales bacterium]|nr:murein biosynthesis integral membrane protein MurJ [Bdellovibrionales bacterium]